MHQVTLAIKTFEKSPYDYFIPIFCEAFKMYKAISYTILRKEITKYKNVLHKYSFEH